MSPDQVLGPWDPGWGERAAPGGRRPTNWGSMGGAPGNFTYFGLCLPFLVTIGVSDGKENVARKLEKVARGKKCNRAA